MDNRKIIVIVEDEESSRTALKWALTNLLRYGDLITLLHVFTPFNNNNSNSISSSSKSKKKNRLMRLKGYQLALSFKEICCTSFFNANIEIVVTEGDRQGDKIKAVVRQIGASVLVVGLHQHSFIYKYAMAHDTISDTFNCRVLAIKQPTSPPSRSRSQRSRCGSQTPSPNHSHSTSMDLSQIDIAGLQVPEVLPQKIPYRICPDPSAIIWRFYGGTVKSYDDKQKIHEVIIFGCSFEEAISASAETNNKNRTDLLPNSWMRFGSSVPLRLDEQTGLLKNALFMEVRNTKAANELIQKWQNGSSEIGLPLNIENPITDKNPATDRANNAARGNHIGLEMMMNGVKNISPRMEVVMVAPARKRRTVVVMVRVRIPRVEVGVCEWRLWRSDDVAVMIVVEIVWWFSCVAIFGQVKELREMGAQLEKVFVNMDGWRTCKVGHVAGL
ncbi:hypothetical protein ACFE04_010239 [Oxalis oulophora]